LGYSGNDYDMEKGEFNVFKKATVWREREAIGKRKRSRGEKGTNWNMKCDYARRRRRYTSLSLSFYPFENRQFGIYLRGGGIYMRRRLSHAKYWTSQGGA
jgi:ribosomal protein S4